MDNKQKQTEFKDDKQPKFADKRLLGVGADNV